ncbi:hypothetical protein SI65_08315 [Aspergillus cristatus]|uniref:VWFA domain-containing protein n=1 Tax=Aspergillus cristatus TaxID=573508 RepID=A0A1E3B5R8_ASPCR|nr:hypothetical protein SI65_08315 [Aspergillus cristatus]
MGQHPSKHDRTSGAIQMQTYTSNTPTYLTETNEKEVQIETKPISSPPSLLTLEPPPPALLNPFTTTSYQTPRQRRSINLGKRNSKRMLAEDEYHDTLTTFLQEYNLVFVVDDSTSMRDNGRWQEVTDVLASIAPICAKHSPDNTGIDIYFLNHHAVSDTSQLGFSTTARGNKGGYTNLQTASQVREIFNAIEPRGPTPFGARLNQLLQPYLRLVENMRIAYYNYHNSINAGSSSAHSPDSRTAAAEYNETERRFYVKPLYVIALTDGAFTDDALKELVRAGKRLDRCRAVPWQLYVQFLQVGQDEGARAFLEVLEGDLKREREREGMGREMVVFPGKGVEYDYRYGGLSAEGVLSGVVKAVSSWV